MEWFAALSVTAPYLVYPKSQKSRRHPIQASYPWPITLDTSANALSATKARYQAIFIVQKRDGKYITATLELGRKAVYYGL